MGEVCDITASADGVNIYICVDFGALPDDSPIQRFSSKVFSDSRYFSGVSLPTDVPTIEAIDEQARQERLEHGRREAEQRRQLRKENIVRRMAEREQRQEERRRAEKARRESEQRNERERERQEQIRKQEELAWNEFRRSEIERSLQERKRQQAEEIQREFTRRELARKRHELISRLKRAFDSDFLTADGILATDPDATLINGEYDQIKASYVIEWAKCKLKQPLDDEQAAAVGATSGDIQVVARAGSGKTQTLVTRALFLQQHCRVSPGEILLLAFNKKAAEDIKSRLAQALGQNLPHVMTFHALAYALVHPDEDLVFDDGSADQLRFSREVQEVIDEHVRSAEYGKQIRDLMLAYFREDWEQIVNGQFQLTREEFLAHRRALPRESLKGEYVKSFGEKLIANTLFEYGVDYKYERSFRWNDINYRPDFTIDFGHKRGGVVIEYFGLLGDADYDQMVEQKRMHWAEQDDWKFLEFTPRDLTQNGIETFVQMLLARLVAAGVACHRRSEEEIWELVKKRALDGFTAAMKNFVSRSRKRNLSPNDLQALVARHTACLAAEDQFIRVAASVYAGYVERLVAENKEDFDGLIWRSAQVVRGGQTWFVRDKGKEQGDVARLRYIMIDEFQDFSHMFFELAEAIRAMNPSAQFFCVGDDWQAINAFAGSDLCFFTNFPHFFRNTSHRHILSNYRSPKIVVKMGNALMHGRGTEAKAQCTDSGWARLAKLDQFKPSAPEQARHNGDDITPAVLRLVKHFLDQRLDVVMLTRRNYVPWYVNYDKDLAAMPDALARFQEHIRTYLPKEQRGRVTVSTTHKYKGLEASAVIVLDAVVRSYPLIHPHWVFLRVFGDSLDRIEDDERRFFYVALTRTKKSLVLLTETRIESPYLDDIHCYVPLDLLVWPSLASMPSLGSSQLEVRVSNAFAVHDQLKKQGFIFRKDGKYWSTAVMAEGFSFDVLLEKPWARDGATVEVYAEDGQLIFSNQQGN
jgi:DNA helicase-4